MDGKQIGIDILDKNFKIRDLGTVSELFVRPVSNRYYRTYECRADNKYGTTMHPVQLEVAHPPGMIRQVVVESITPTSLIFRFVPPERDGGVKIDCYIVEFKELQMEWKDSTRRYWFEGTFVNGCSFSFVI